MKRVDAMGNVTCYAYDALHRLTVTYGSGDSDSFFYSSETGLPTGYTLGAGSYSQAATITNNQNGTVSQFQLVDSFQSLNSETCNYSYDDFMRLISNTCGQIWGSAYTYDPFGNVDKSMVANSSGTAFNPTYNESLNQFSSIPSVSGPYYDGNGNVIKDQIHSYGYDAEGNLITVDSVAGTFDALNRRVEVVYAGTYYQMLYPPFAPNYQMSAASGPAASALRVPLPGGGQAVYGSGGLNTYLHPNWQGSQPLSSATTQGAPLAGSNFTPFGELYNPYPGGENAFFAGMLGIADSGPLTDGYQSATRFYSNLQGRWTSPDTAGLSAVDPTNPQSWNRYAYVLNNPLSGIDPLGMLNDCGGAICTPFQESSGQPGCYYSYTYYWVTGSDGILYQMPSVQLVCNGGGSSSYGGGPNGQTGGGSGSTGNLGLTKRQACYADALVNGALGFVPGYNATKTVASLVGFNFNPVQFANGDTGALSGFSSGASPFSAGSPTVPQITAGVASAGSIYSDASFAAAGGASALSRAQNLISRGGFALRSLPGQAKLLQQAAALEKLAQAASLAKNLGTVFSLASTAFDLYQCSQQ
jgi:RHS repeat-associated protein